VILRILVFTLEFRGGESNGACIAGISSTIEIKLRPTSSKLKTQNSAILTMRRATNSKSDLSSKSTRIPVSLGKPSLRVRLEAYYSLIEPSRLHDKTNWRKNVDEIYKKVSFGHVCQYLAA
jgi:hypothetical protein